MNDVGFWSGSGSGLPGPGAAAIHTFSSGRRLRASGRSDVLAMVGSARQALWASIVCKRSPTSWPVKSSTKTAESGTSCSARCKTSNLRSCPPARLPARLATVPLRPNRALLYRISVRVASSSYTARIIVKGPRLANQGNPGLMLPRQGNGTEGTPRSPPTRRRAFN